MIARPTVHLTIGGVEARREPAQLRTLLGSCISACLWDPRARIGGMNHFMLPQGAAAGGDPGRFGVHAMDLLVGALQRLGAERGRLQAKIFGGGAVLADVLHSARVPEQNVVFIEHFMRIEGIPVIAKDLGGTQPRQVIFLTDTGQAFVKRLGQERKREQVREERRLVAAPVVAPPPVYGEIELWN